MWRRGVGKVPGLLSLTATRTRRIRSPSSGIWRGLSTTAMSSSSSNDESSSVNQLHENWVRLKNQLLQQHENNDNGNEHHNNRSISLQTSQVVELLNEMRRQTTQRKNTITNSHSQKDTTNSSFMDIRDGFALLDLLCQQRTPESSEKPLDEGVLKGLLVSWRDEATTHPNSPSLLLLSPFVVWEKVERYLQLQLVEPTPSYLNIILYTLAQTATLGKSRSITRAQAPRIAEDLLQRQQQLSGSDNALTCPLHPNEKTIRTLVELWAGSGLPEAPDQALALLGQLQQWNTEYNKRQHQQQPEQQQQPESNPLPSIDLVPTPAIYCAIMDAYTRSGERGASTRHSKSSRRHQPPPQQQQHNLQSPQAILDRVQTMYRKMKRECQPQDLKDEIIYTRVCHALANCRHAQAPDLAHQVLQEMCNEVSAPEKPVAHAFGTVMTAYGRVQRNDEAQRVMDEMQELAATRGPPWQPDAACFDALIWAHAHAGDTAAVEQVLLQRLEQVGNEDQEGSKWTSALNGLLASWLDSNQPIEAAQQMTQFIDHWLSLADQGHIPRDSVDISTYNLLMSAHARKHSAQGALEAQELMDWLRKASLEPNQEHLQPNGESYFGLLTAYANAGQAQKSDDVLWEWCDQVQQRTVSLDEKFGSKPFNIVMEAWSKQKAPNRVQVVFDRMANLAEVFLEEGQTNLAFQLRPNLVDYNVLLWAWARSASLRPHSSAESLNPENRDDPLQYVEQIFEEMEDDDTLEDPNQITYHAILYAMVHSPEPNVMERAEFFFKGIPFRNAELYNTMMTAWSQRGHPEKTDKLFQEMHQQHVKDPLKYPAPTWPLIVSRLQAWSRAGVPERAALVLQEMIEESKPGGLWPNERPDLVSFNAILMAWLRSNRQTAADKAAPGLARMIALASSGEFECFPDVFSFTTVISAYSKSSLPHAGDRAWDLLGQMGRLAELHPEKAASLQPNLMTHTEVILALLRTTPEETGLPRVRQLFREMRDKSPQDVFWKKQRIPDHMTRIRKELRNCSYPQKQILMDEFSQLAPNHWFQDIDEEDDQRKVKHRAKMPRGKAPSQDRMPRGKAPAQDRMPRGKVTAQDRWPRGKVPAHAA